MLLVRQKNLRSWQAASTPDEAWHVFEALGLPVQAEKGDQHARSAGSILKVLLPQRIGHGLDLLQNAGVGLVPPLPQLAEQVDQNADHQRSHQPLQDEGQHEAVHTLHTTLIVIGLHCSDVSQHMTQRTTVILP